MMKYLLLALLAVWLCYSPAVRRQMRRPADEQGAGKSRHAPPVQVMQTCAHCGIHFPQNDGVRVTQSGHDLYFCCAEHMRAGARSS